MRAVSASLRIGLTIRPWILEEKKKATSIAATNDGTMIVPPLTTLWYCAARSDSRYSVPRRSEPRVIGLYTAMRLQVMAVPSPAGDS